MTYIVELSKADWSQPGPAQYTVALTFKHRTLKAACRRLAHYIARQSRTGATCERFDRMLIVMPSGERWPLNTARAYLESSK